MQTLCKPFVDHLNSYSNSVNISSFFDVAIPQLELTFTDNEAEIAVLRAAKNKRVQARTVIEQLQAEISTNNKKTAQILGSTKQDDPYSVFMRQNIDPVGVPVEQIAEAFFNWLQARFSNLDSDRYSSLQQYISQLFVLF